MANPVTRTQAMVDISIRDSRPRFKPKISVPRFENLDAFDTQHFGLTGFWNMPMHRGSEERGQRTALGDLRVETEAVLGANPA